jgi:pimeloyl-ACP methyl ester carboxylesterase
VDRENAAAEYRDAVALVAAAASTVTRTVRRMHLAIARRPFRVFTAMAPTSAVARPVQRLHDGISDLVYSSVAAGITVGGAVAEAAAHSVGRALPKDSLTESPAGRAVNGVVCGAFGELPHTPAAVMTLRLDGTKVDIEPGALARAYPRARGHVVLFLHGLIETERWWFHRSGAGNDIPDTDFGARLAADLGCTPLYVRYHTGRHISINGANLDELLCSLVDAWPVPVRRISIVGHSMGGLVARSAAHQASTAEHDWARHLDNVVCLGTPHRGAPLERGAHLLGRVIDLFPESAPLGNLLRSRSPGIKDLRYGYLHEQQWLDRDPDAAIRRADPVETLVPPATRQRFFTATVSRNRDGLPARMFGDILVTPSSSDDDRQQACRHWAGGMHHFGLLHRDEVYQQLLAWLSEPAPIWSGWSPARRR